MIRPAAVALAALLVTACDQRASAPTAPERLGNNTGGQSIMQPEVIAETAPTPTPTPEPPAPSGTTVPFAQGSKLDDAGRAAIDTLLAAPRLPTDTNWVLRGHSDSPGSDQANLVTSRHRAEAVRSYLIAKGIGADRISVIALGERRPAAPNATLYGGDDPDGRARNRRVDIELVPAPAPSVPAPSVGPTATRTPA